MQWLSPVLELKWTPRLWKCCPRSMRKYDFKKDTWILDTLYLHILPIYNTFSEKLGHFNQKNEQNCLKMAHRLDRWVTDYNRPINRSFFRRLIGRLIGIGRSLVFTIWTRFSCHFQKGALLICCDMCCKSSEMPIIPIAAFEGSH